MIVKTILAAKGGEVVSIEPTANLVAAAKLLTKHRIGVLVVTDAGGRLVGILSERDIMRVLAENASAALHLSVAEVMTRDVSTCDVSDSIVLPNGWSDQSGSSVWIISSSGARGICAGSCEPMPAITMTSERTGHWTKMRRLFVPFTGSGTSRHTQSSVGFITATFGFRFSVHTGLKIMRVNLPAISATSIAAPICWPSARYCFALS